MNIRGRGGQFQPGLFSPETIAEALADAMQHAAPTGRRKYIETRLKMRTDDARRVAESRASKVQLDHAFKVGGWPLVLDVFARLLGEGLDQHLERERRRHADLAEDLGEVVRSFRAAGAGGPGNGARVASAQSGDMGARPAARSGTEGE